MIESCFFHFSIGITKIIFKIYDNLGKFCKKIIYMKSYNLGYINLGEINLGYINLGEINLGVGKLSPKSTKLISPPNIFQYLVQYIVQYLEL